MTPDPGDKKVIEHINDTYITNVRLPNGAIQLKEVLTAQNLFCVITIISQNSVLH